MAPSHDGPEEDSGAVPTEGGELWVLYADGTVAIIQLAELLAKLRANTSGTVVIS
jgi:hypothetical protein